MEYTIIKRLPKILKINHIDKNSLVIYVLFSTGENKKLNFGSIFKSHWKITKKDLEFKLTDPREFSKVKLRHNALSWPNIEVEIIGKDKKIKKVPYEVGADTLYDLSESDDKRTLSIGAMFRKARLLSQKTQQEVAELAGTSRTYITRLENGKQDIELLTLKKLVEAGLNKKLKIIID